MHIVIIYGSEPFAHDEYLVETFDTADAAYDRFDVLASSLTRTYLPGVILEVLKEDFSAYHDGECRVLKRLVYAI